MFVLVAFLAGGLMGMMLMSALVQSSRSVAAHDSRVKTRHIHYPDPVPAKSHFAPVMDARYTAQDWMN